MQILLSCTVCARMMSEETVSEKTRRDPFEHFQPIGRKKHDRSLQLEKSCTEPGARRNAKAVECKDAGNQALLVHTEYDTWINCHSRVSRGIL